ncbi:glycosyltransferase [Candidatus Peregrinibacteria bacterium]|nr:glycosyltransferase [Candidatus Peregrinibacteria bacterium]
MKTILLISPYWKEEHRWMVSSFKLAELWQRLGYRVVAVCMGRETKVDHISDTLSVHYRKDIFLPDPLNFGIAFGFWCSVWRLIKKEKPDILVCNKVLFWSSFSLIPLRILGYRFILLTDALVGMTWWPRPRFAKVIMGIGGWTVGWLVLLCAKQVVFFHPQPESLLKKLGVWKKSQVIPTGIDCEKYKLRTAVRGPEGPSGPERENVSGNFVVTYIGRLESVKGADDFLAAAVPLKKQYPHLTIQVVGWYKTHHPLVEKYREDVLFTGLRSDIPAILSETDIFILPSYSEGLSNALMEAMASGCSCIASDVGGNRFLLQNGVSGFLFPPGDREALRAHIHRLIEDAAKRRTLGEAARKRIEEEFDWKVVGEKYAELFNNI